MASAAAEVCAGLACPARGGGALAGAGAEAHAYEAAEETPEELPSEAQAYEASASPRRPREDEATRAASTPSI
eukprot:15254781-Heterocapsa_arctica.AAC.1